MTDRDSRPEPAGTAALGPTLAAVAAGGVLGALARHALLGVLPPRDDAVDLATLLVNVTGCALIGVLMAVLARRPGAHPLLRPFLGVGVLGGYTTFSAAVTDATAAFAAHRPETALLSLAANLVGALAAVWVAGGAATALLDRAAARRGAA